MRPADLIRTTYLHVRNYYAGVYRDAGKKTDQIQYVNCHHQFIIRNERWRSGNSRSSRLLKSVMPKPPRVDSAHSRGVVKGYALH